MKVSYVVTYAGNFYGYYINLDKACTVYNRVKKEKIEEIVSSRNFEKAGALLLIKIASPDYSERFKGFNTCKIIKSAEIGLCGYRKFVLKDNK